MQKSKGFTFVISMVLIMIALVGCQIKQSDNNSDASQLSKIDKNLPKLEVKLSSGNFNAVTGIVNWKQNKTDYNIKPLSKDLTQSQERYLTAEKGSQFKLIFSRSPIKYSIKEIGNESKVLDTKESYTLPDIGEQVVYEVNATWDEGDIQYIFTILLK